MPTGGRYGLADDLDHVDHQPLYGSELGDPAITVVEHQLVTSELDRMPDKTREVAALVLAGHSFTEVAERLGTTERAVEGGLYRYRTKRSRRRNAGSTR